MVLHSAIPPSLVVSADSHYCGGPHVTKTTTAPVHEWSALNPKPLNLNPKQTFNGLQPVLMLACMPAPAAGMQTHGWRGWRWSAACGRCLLLGPSSSAASGASWRQTGSWGWRCSGCASSGKRAGGRGGRFMRWRMRMISRSVPDQAQPHNPLGCCKDITVQLWGVLICAGLAEPGHAT